MSIRLWLDTPQLPRAFRSSLFDGDGHDCGVKAMIETAVPILRVANLYHVKQSSSAYAFEQQGRDRRRIGREVGVQVRGNDRVLAINVLAPAVAVRNAIAYGL